MKSLAEKRAVAKYVRCPADCYEGSGKKYFSKGELYEIVGKDGGVIYLYTDVIGRGVCCLWDGCAYLPYGVSWEPIEEVVSGQLEFQFD